MSLVLSCALIAWWTRSMATKARSMARSARSPPAAVRISTSVPRSGRARLTLAQLAFMEAEEPLHALGDMPAGKRRATDVGDVAVKLQRIVGVLAEELRPPAALAHLAAVRFPVLQDLEPAHSAVAAKRQRVGDQLVLAEHLIDDEPAFAVGAPDALAPGAFERHQSCPREERLLRLLDGQIDGRMRGGQRECKRRDEEHRPALAIRRQSRA